MNGSAACFGNRGMIDKPQNVAPPLQVEAACFRPRHPSLSVGINAGVKHTEGASAVLQHQQTMTN